MQFKLFLALLSLVSFTSAVPQGYGNSYAPQSYNNGGYNNNNHHGGYRPRRYKLRINTHVVPGYDKLNAYHGQYLYRRDDQNFGGNYYNRASVNKKGDYFYFSNRQPQTLYTKSGLDTWWINLGDITNGNTGLVEFTKKDEGNPIIVGGKTLAVTYNRFSGWFLYPSQYGVSLLYSVGPWDWMKQCTESPFPCGPVSIEAVPA